MPALTVCTARDVMTRDSTYFFLRMTVSARRSPQSSSGSSSQIHLPMYIRGGKPQMLGETTRNGKEESQRLLPVRYRTTTFLSLK